MQHAHNAWKFIVPGPRFPPGTRTACTGNDIWIIIDSGKYSIAGAIPAVRNSASTTAGAPRAEEAVQSGESANSAVAQKLIRYCNVISDGLNGAWNKQSSFCLRLSACHERVRTSEETDNKQSCLRGPLKRVRGRAFVGFACRITSQRQLRIQSSSQREDARPKGDERENQREVSRFGRAFVPLPRRRWAVPRPFVYERTLSRRVLIFCSLLALLLSSPLAISQDRASERCLVLPRCLQQPSSSCKSLL